MKKFTFVLLMLCSFQCFSSGHFGTKWVIVNVNDNAETYIDPTTIRREGTIRKFWAFHNLKVRNARYGHMSIRTRQEIDCKKQTSRITSVHQFSESMLKGTVTGNYSYPDDVWSDIAPDSMDEALMEYVCPK